MTRETDQNRFGTLPVEDELRLNAYLDGELSPEERAEVEAWLQRDPVAADRLERMRTLDARAREALDVALDRPVGEATQAILERLRQRDAGVASTPDGGSRGAGWWPSLAGIAASLMILAVGYGLGVTLTQSRFDARLAAVEASRTELRAALNKALEYTPSGTTVRWSSSRYNARAELEPVRTLKSGDGRYCREFRETLIVDGVREERRGLSCRVGQEQWQTRLIVPKEGKELF